MAKAAPTPVLTDTETLTEVIDCLAEHLEIPMQEVGDQHTLFEILTLHFRSIQSFSLIIGILNGKVEP